jgi:hypothetical protein
MARGRGVEKSGLWRDPRFAAKDGAPFLFGCPKENKDNSRSLRDDNKKAKATTEADSSAALRNDKQKMLRNDKQKGCGMTNKKTSSNE